MNAVPSAAPTPALPGGKPVPTGAMPARDGSPQNFAATIGELAANPAPAAPVAPKLPGMSGAPGAAEKTGKSKSARLSGGDTTAAGSPLPPAGNPLPSGAAGMPGLVSVGNNVIGNGGDGSADGDGRIEAGVIEADSATASRSAPLATDDLSAAASGAASTRSTSGLDAAFSRLLNDGIEHVPKVLSAETMRVAGGGASPLTGEAGVAPDRGPSRGLVDTDAAANTSATAVVSADAIRLAANAGAAVNAGVEANSGAAVDAAGFARARSVGGTSSAAAAAMAVTTAAPAGTADAAAGADSSTNAIADARAVGGAGAGLSAISAIASAFGGTGKHAQDIAVDATPVSNMAAPPLDGASAAAHAGAGVVAAAPPTDASAAAPGKIDAPITSPEFTQAVASRVSYLVDNNLNGATLQVTPPQLGPIELRVTIEAGHTQVSMSAHNPATLDALQAGAPKLRELLGAQGFGQVSVDVSQRSFQEGSPYAQSRPWIPSSDSDPTVNVAEASVATARAPLGMLDAYA